MSEDIKKQPKPKLSSRVKKQIDSTLDKINRITRHIRNVEDNCILLGTKLIQEGNIELGRRLIANSFLHDVSKFHGIEFDFMGPETPTEEDNAKLKFKMAVYQHQRTNPHHPEYWSGGIRNMPDVYLAELASDWKARSEEFGTNLREWIDIHATRRWNFEKDDETYKKIMRFVDMICEKPFEEVK